MAKLLKKTHLKLVSDSKGFDESGRLGAADLINPDDFKSIVLKVGILNSTTKTEIRGGKRIYGVDGAKTQKNENEDDLSIQITEYAEKGMSLEAPPHACATSP